MKYVALAVVEIEVGDGETPQSVLDRFRESVQPSSEYGVCIYLATPEDVGKLAGMITAREKK